MAMTQQLAAKRFRPPVIVTVGRQRWSNQRMRMERQSSRHSKTRTLPWNRRPARINRPGAFSRGVMPRGRELVRIRESGVEIALRDSRRVSVQGGRIMTPRWSRKDERQYEHTREK